jgi:3-oxoacyl-[acyl-carrier protein] reductase
MKEFHGKTALVTGGSRGIGKAVAVALAGEGATIAVNYVENRKAADAVAQSIRAAGGNAFSVRADVARHADVRKMQAEIRKTAGDVDILVNNAGIHQHLKVWELRPADWERVMAVNLTGVYNCCNVFTPAMMKKKWGRIVNISSVSGITGTDHEIHYASSKGGMIAATRSLALELVPYGIRVNCVAPGHILTDMTTTSSTPAERKEWTGHIPMKRYGEPNEIADAVVFLCSKKSSYITGETLNVNGGLSFA